MVLEIILLFNVIFPIVEFESFLDNGMFSTTCHYP